MAAGRLRSRNRNGERLAFFDGVAARNGHHGGQHGRRGGWAARYHQLQVAPGGANQHLPAVDGAVLRHVDGHHVLALGGAAVAGHARAGIYQGEVAGPAAKWIGNAKARAVRHRVGQGQKADGKVVVRLRPGRLKAAVRSAEGIDQAVTVGVHGIVQGNGGIVLANHGDGRIRKHRRPVVNQRRCHAHVKRQGLVAGVVDVVDIVVAGRHRKHGVVPVE